MIIKKMFAPKITPLYFYEVVGRGKVYVVNTKSYPKVKFELKKIVKINEQFFQIRGIESSTHSPIISITVVGVR